MIYALLGLVALLFLSKGGLALGGLSLGASATPIVPQAVPVAPSPYLNTNPALTIAGQSVQTSLSVASNEAGKIANVLGTSVQSVSSAIPVVGAVFGAILSSLMAASAQRKAQATNENKAVGAAVPGWDAAVAQVVGAYNNGSITANQVSQLLDQIMQNFWNETGPVIQPGRNGCNAGSNCPPSVSLTYCSGDIGAACCVGCADLEVGVRAMNVAVQQADNTGKPTPALIPTIYPSKYGGVSRQQYTVTFAKPGLV